MAKSKYLKVALVAGLGLLGACSFLGDKADDHLGVVCNDDARIFRADQLNTMLATHFGEDRILRLAEDVELMQASADAGTDLNAAGDAYRADFIKFAIVLLAEQGIKVALSDYDEAVDRLKDLPELISDINRIEAKVAIQCSGVT
ncbi:hypothetical protein COB52_00055 [Candidatus Kaiserbacteria bacterium]|nr:MAG: hypothetical protein COB52_00055 [Candidatus Kaiserbacteria bacterium]